jgi:hypothetical protein
VTLVMPSAPMTQGFTLPRIATMSPDARLARLSTEAPRIPWDSFITRILRWEAGEHFSLIGNTGQGKTTMMLNLLPLHPFVVVFATKPRDKTMTALINTGYLRMDRWRSLDPNQYPRRALWPDATRIDSDQLQKDVFHDAFARIYREGHWTVAIDETWWLSNVLGLDKDIKTYLLQARSLDISLLLATQRPAWVPREMYTQSTHLMFWRTNDETDLRSLSGIGYKSASVIQDAVMNLESHQTLYINTRTGFMCRTRCPDVRLPSSGARGGNAR